MLQELLEPVINSIGYELVGVERLPQQRGVLVRIYIDCEEGVRLTDCEHVSRQVSSVLDVEDPIPGEYTLEVSSPGMDRPLFTPEHYTRHVGRKIRVQLRRPLNGRRNFSGVLQGIVDEQVLLLEKETEHHLPLEQIDKARLAPEEATNSKND